jgi:hypothetical protein
VKDETIFVLRHEHDINGYDSTIIIGVYSQRSLAEDAQARFEKEPGFSDHVDGFIIHECKIDEDLWSGGFITVP